MSQPIQADSMPKSVGLVGGSAAARRADKMNQVNSRSGYRS